MPRTVEYETFRHARNAARKNEPKGTALYNQIISYGLGVRRAWPTYQMPPQLRWMIVGVMPDRIYDAMITREVSMRRPFPEEVLRKEWFHKATGEYRFWPFDTKLKDKKDELGRLRAAHDTILRQIRKDHAGFDPDVDLDEDEEIMRLYHRGDIIARYPVNRWKREGGGRKTLKGL